MWLAQSVHRFRERKLYWVFSRIATFSPAVLPANPVCTATISTALRDTTGLALATDFVWTFKTGAIPDIIRPTVTLTAPLAGATNVAFKRKSYGNL